MSHWRQEWLFSSFKWTFAMCVFTWEDWVNFFAQMLQSKNLFPLVCPKMWPLRVPGCLNDWRQMLHSKSFSSLCDSMCVLREWRLKKGLLHIWHIWVFLPVCSCLCVRRVISPENVLLHLSHESDIFSWVLTWLLRPSGCVKVIIHLGQLKFLFPLCKCICVFKLCANENILPHSLHSKFFSPLCIRKWVFKWSCFLNDFVHSLHLYGFGPVGSGWIFLCFVSPPKVKQSSPHTQQKYVFCLLTFLGSITGDDALVVDFALTLWTKTRAAQCKTHQNPDKEFVLHTFTFSKKKAKYGWYHEVGHVQYGVRPPPAISENKKKTVSFKVTLDTT